MRWLSILVLSLCSASASAGVPDPFCYSIVPQFIRIGGTQTTAGEPDPTLQFTIAVIDCQHNPRANTRVVVDFANCSDTKLCPTVVAGQVIDCVAKTVEGTTDANGEVRFTILGAATNAGTTVPPTVAAGAGSGCVRVFYAHGILLATVTAVVYDQNGALAGGNGVNGLDLAIAKNDVGASGLGAPYRGRSDYTGDTAVNGADLAVLKTIVGRSGLGLGSGAGCTSGGAPMPYCP